MKINYQDVIIFKGTNPEATGSKYLVSCGFNVINPKPRNKWFKLIIKICQVLRIYSRSLAKFFWNIDLSILSKASAIILFDSNSEYYFCSFLQHYFSDKKLILYYWNTIDAEKERELSCFVKKGNWEIYSYNPDDCIKYKIKYNKLFSPVNNSFVKLNTNEIRQDVFFVGKNKGRIKQLIEIKHNLDVLGISYKFICPDAGLPPQANFYIKQIPYEEVLIEDMRSKAILEINPYNNSMTMRELEALFLKKKLITDNKSIIERDYYHPDNVFIIDYSNTYICDGLTDFLEKPFVDIDNEIIKSYSVESWIDRFNIT